MASLRVETSNWKKTLFPAGMMIGGMEIEMVKKEISSWSKAPTIPQGVLEIF